MIGIFCSYQTLNLPSVFKCSTNTTRIPANQTETVIQCNDLHYKEKSNLNIAIIVINTFIMMLAILELCHLLVTREKFQEKLLGDVLENLSPSNEATGNSSQGKTISSENYRY